ncbi:1,3-beta-glucan synthase regulatory factor Chf3/Chr4 [Schizosaccharomyces japonicus yFS275]|uniref:1,3-beta-glucan synthase regulatory factor Chf3/Chr4 n=1 Tax=Schizosaccharomyces japonicus (strain yFS275 / FY16936) TaxID=402676 RepID=B6JXZ3_SCHJY|nr:1,3-beta-glucan synthase regulatory factor Chf3/Chr4 [Schizosaccharomyces japonicus yFS275]EEB06411.1 1,3-beta-glucan synthase regulatory factor Chf3/Chr4 [Schizosaccharomyces japonicus yFS275]
MQRNNLKHREGTNKYTPGMANSAVSVAATRSHSNFPGRDRSKISMNHPNDSHLSAIQDFYISSIQSSIPFESDAIIPAYGIGDMIVPEINENVLNPALGSQVSLARPHFQYAMPNISSSSVMSTIKRATNSSEIPRSSSGTSRFASSLSVAQTSHEDPRSHRQHNASPLQKQVQYDIPFALPITGEEQLVWLQQNEEAAHSNEPEAALEWAEFALNCCAIEIPYYQTNRPDSQTLEALEQVCTFALTTIRDFASQGNIRAIYDDARTYEVGIFDVCSDIDQAWQMYADSAAQGHARSLYRLGVILEEQGDLEGAVQYFERGIEENDTACCWRLGLLILEGELDNMGYAEQRSRGVDLIRQSAKYADADSPSGLYSYGLLLLHEHPGFVDLDAENVQVERDEHTAVRSFAKAAFLGNSSAQLRMGAVFEFGKYGLPLNPEYSVLYYTLASRQGETEADVALSKWYLHGGHNVPKDADLSYEHASKAAVAGNATGQFITGYIEEMRGNIDDAINWYSAAASNAHEEAQDRLQKIQRKRSHASQAAQAPPNEEPVAQAPRTVSELKKASVRASKEITSVAQNNPTAAKGASSSLGNRHSSKTKKNGCTIM